ncbi:MAG: ABC transporter permease, partial [Chloroflexota bacterium]
GAIDRILAANHGSDDAAAAANSSAAAGELYAAAPYALSVDQAKAEGLRQADQAEEIFSRIFTLFALFAAGVGLLLVFLIFTILAAERRPEMGISRVIGMKRRDLIVLYLHEGTAYALVAAGLGVGLGIGIGASIVDLLNRVLTNYGFGLAFVVHPRVAAIAYGLGLLATWLTVMLACWWATRLTIASAIRDLPEPEEAPISAARLLLLPWGRLYRAMVYSRRPGYRMRAARRFAADLTASLLGAALAFCLRGPGLTLIGLLIARLSAAAGQSSVFAIGVTMALLGMTPTMRCLLRALRVRMRTADRISFTLAGALLVAYWSLPASAPARLGLPPLQTGIEIFFLAGVTMVLGAVWIAMYNLDALLRPLATVPRLPGRLTAAVRTAAAYTLHRPARTGLILAMFALVSFTLTVMEVVTDALQRDYGDVAAQTGGFDIRGDLLYNDPITSLKSAMRHSPYVDAHAFSFAGSQGYEPVGVVQLSAARPSWRLTYADVLAGDFLQGTTFHLLSRAAGYTSDAAVWTALRKQPGLALIGSDLLSGDVGAGLPTGGAGVPPPYTLGLPMAAGFAPVDVWMADPRGGSAIKLRIIGVADDAAGRHGGLIVPARALTRGGIPPILATQYFRVRPGQDVTRQARAIGSAFLEHGLQTTVLVNAVWAQRGPKILLARLLQGFVGLVLLLGIAGLAATALRSVAERRQQIGMMRALGMPRMVIRLAFLLESSMVALAGLGIGVALGLLLARNLFLADFFEQYQTGLTMRVPWEELGLIVVATYLAAMLATFLPAVFAGRVSPVEALIDR